MIKNDDLQAYGAFIIGAFPRIYATRMFERSTKTPGEGEIRVEIHITDEMSKEMFHESKETVISLLSGVLMVYENTHNMRLAVQTVMDFAKSVGYINTIFSDAFLEDEKMEKQYETSPFITEEMELLKKRIIELQRTVDNPIISLLERIMGEMPVELKESFMEVQRHMEEMDLSELHCDTCKKADSCPIKDKIIVIKAMKGKRERAKEPETQSEQSKEEISEDKEPEHKQYVAEVPVMTKDEEIIMAVPVLIPNPAEPKNIN